MIHVNSLAISWLSAADVYLSTQGKNYAPYRSYILIAIYYTCFSCVPHLPPIFYYTMQGTLYTYLALIYSFAFFFVQFLPTVATLFAIGKIWRSLWKCSFSLAHWHMDPSRQVWTLAANMWLYYLYVFLFVTWAWLCKYYNSGYFIQWQQIDHSLSLFFAMTSLFTYSYIYVLETTKYFHPSVFKNSPEEGIYKFWLRSSPKHNSHLPSTYPFFDWASSLGLDGTG